jgi:hypothetical protein
MVHRMNAEDEASQLSALSRKSVDKVKVVVAYKVLVLFADDVK